MASQMPRTGGDNKTDSTTVAQLCTDTQRPLNRVLQIGDFYAGSS